MSGDSLTPLPVAEVPRITLRQGEAAAALGVSVPQLMKLVDEDGLPCIRRGRRLVLFPVDELRRWAANQAASGDR